MRGKRKKRGKKWNNNNTKKKSPGRWTPLSRILNTLAAAWTRVWHFSLLPALLLVVIILWSTAVGRPLGATVLLGLLQELVQTKGILLKLNGSLSSLPMICTWELFVWNKPDGVGQKKTGESSWGDCLNRFGGLTFTLVKHFAFYPVLLHTAGIQTFLEDNDKLVTKHMGQAMLGW